MSRYERQTLVLDWLNRTFRFTANWRDPKERALRVVEEAIELAQTVDVPIEMIERLVQRVYDREVGETFKELGGVGITLLAFAAATNLDADLAEAAELRRIVNIDPEHFRTKQHEKNLAGVGIEWEPPERHIKP